MTSTATSTTATATTSATRQLIINGETAPKGRYPYFTTLRHYCGGALIAPDVVLTAGHCKPKKIDSVHPHVGRYSFANDDNDDDSEEFQIVQAIRHPGWVRVGDDEFRNDVTLLRLDRPSTSTPIVRINRQDSVPQNHQTVVAMGVGFTHADYDSKADTLQRVQLNALSNELCVNSHRRRGGGGGGDGGDDDENEELSYQGRIFPSHLCTTGGPHNERDACAYDSGSPIIIPGETAEEDLLVGLVSWGEGCADQDFPGVNARISAMSDWIDATVCEMSADPPSEFCLSAATAQHPGVGFVWIVELVVGLVVGVWVARLMVASRVRHRQPQEQDISSSAAAFWKGVTGTPRTTTTSSDADDLESYGSMDETSGFLLSSSADNLVSLGS